MSIAGRPSHTEGGSLKFRRISQYRNARLHHLVVLTCRRPVQAGEGGASASGAGENGSSTTTQSSGGGDSGGDSGAQPAKPSGGGKKKGKHEPDHTYDDGSVLFTAETLAKVSFDELKP